jgi:hypothetical protein
VDQALRARVTEFFQNFVDGTFRKAFDLVADDTKDDFYGSRTPLKSFEVQKVLYSEDFATAEVTVGAERIWSMAGQSLVVNLPFVTSWKIERGKWVYHHDPAGDLATPMGGTRPAANDPSSAPAGIPKDLSDTALLAVGKSILGQSRVDKSDVTLATDRVSESQVVFHNGMPGPVQLTVRTSAEIPGLSAKLEKAQVNGSGDATLVLRYEPPSAPAALLRTTVQLAVAPTGQVFDIVVKLASPPTR